MWFTQFELDQDEYQSGVWTLTHTLLIPELEDELWERIWEIFEHWAERFERRWLAERNLNLEPGSLQVVLDSIAPEGDITDYFEPPWEISTRGYRRRRLGNFVPPQ